MNCDATLNVSVRSLSSTCRRRHGRLVLGRLQTVLPLLAPLEQVADTQVELGAVVQVVAR